MFYLNTNSHHITVNNTWDATEALTYSMEANGSDLKALRCKQINLDMSAFPESSLCRQASANIFFQKNLSIHLFSF
jgi:hypothetical protein